MSTLSSPRKHLRDSSTGPWWHHTFVWLLIATPLIAVVVAGLTTVYIAVDGADPVVSGRNIKASQGLTEVPAGQARNHAATGVLPEEK